VLPNSSQELHMFIVLNCVLYVYSWINGVCAFYLRLYLGYESIESRNCLSSTVAVSHQLIFDCEMHFILPPPQPMVLLGKVVV
jgi:hypothetical protein